MCGDDRYRLSALVDEQGRVVGARTSTIEEPACFARTLRECNEIFPSSLQPSAGTSGFKAATAEVTIWRWFSDLHCSLINRSSNSIKPVIWSRFLRVLAVHSCFLINQRRQFNFWRNRSPKTVQDLTRLKRVLMSVQDKPQRRAMLLLFCCLLLYKGTGLVFCRHFYMFSE